MKTILALIAVAGISTGPAYAESSTTCVVTTTTVTGDTSGQLPEPKVINKVCNLKPDAALKLYYARQVLMGELARMILEKPGELDKVVGYATDAP